jgi:hypothetical protein
MHGSRLLLLGLGVCRKVGSGRYLEKPRQNYNQNRLIIRYAMRYSGTRLFWVASARLLPAMELAVGK